MVNEELSRGLEGQPGPSSPQSPPAAEPAPPDDFELPPEAFCQEPVVDSLEGEGTGDRFEPPPEPPPPQPPPISGEKILSLLEGAVEAGLRVPCRMPEEWRKYAGEILDAVGPPALVPARPANPKSRWKWLLGIGGAYLGLVLFRGVSMRRELARLQAQAAQSQDNVGEEKAEEEEQHAADHPEGGGLGAA